MSSWSSVIIMRKFGRDNEDSKNKSDKHARMKSIISDGRKNNRYLKTNYPENPELIA